MPKGYHHLTYEKRCQLYALKKSGESYREIAKHLEVDRSTIYRELNRNRGGNSYRFKQAHQKAVERRQKSSGHRNKMTPDVIVTIERKLNL